MSAEVVWLRDVRQDGVIAFRVGTQGQRLVGEWPHVGRLTCARDGSRPRLEVHDGAPPLAVLKLRGFIRALLVDLRGGLGLHASAVSVDGKAVVFLGKSGMGKSTTAAEFCIRHRAELLADDAAILELRNDIPTVVPNEDTVCLQPDARRALRVRGRSDAVWKNKRFVRPRAVANRACMLRLVVALRFDDRLTHAETRQLVGGEAALRLLGSMIRFDITDAVARKHELDVVMQVYNTVRFVEIARPRHTPSVAPQVFSALDSLVLWGAR